MKYSWLLMMMVSVMVSGIEGGCIEEERKALLQIKTSLIHSYDFYADPPLLSWVDDGGECCDWERVNCNTTTGHVTHLSLRNIVSKTVYEDCKRNWPLNVSVFLHFKELTSLNLSRNCLDDGIVNTGLVTLSSLKKLETLDLSSNSITNGTLPSLGALTSLRVLDLHENYLEGYFPALALENLEILDLSNNIGMEGFERLSLFKKLKILKLKNNEFNESLITSLSALSSLKALELQGNYRLFGSFPAQELSHMTNLEELDLSWNELNDTPSIQECMRLSRLKNLKSIDLGSNNFDKSIISCLSVLPSLKALYLYDNRLLGGSFPIQELSGLKELETLDLSFCGLTSLALNGLSHLPNLKVLLLSGNYFNGTLPIKALASFHHLEVLDLSENYFVGSIPSTIQALSSLRVVSFAINQLNGSLSNHGLCELMNLHELDLSGNMFNGNLPQCFNTLSSLKLLDISSNQFTGTLLSSLIANLTSLEYVDFGGNNFEGSFPFNSFSNLTKLEVVKCMCRSNKFEVETEEPIGWIPMFQLKVLVLSSCNINRPKGSVFPGFLHHQYKLGELHLPHNFFMGQFPNWLIENNTMLETLNLRNNSLTGTICMSRYRNANMRWLDVSGNHMNGTILDDIQRFLPNIEYFNLSGNLFDGVIPASIGDMRKYGTLDLSRNELSGEVSNGLLTNLSFLGKVILSKNRLHGHVFSANLSFGNIERLGLDNNYFTGKIGNMIRANSLQSLDISNNLFTGMIPHWMSNMTGLSELRMSHNSFEGRFPCGTTSFSFLDISHNSFSGPIPYCLDGRFMNHLHLGSNRFTGSIPNVFRGMTNVLTLDIGNNFFSGRIPKFLGELSNLRILILRKNNFSGSTPMKLCQLNMSLIDLSGNSLSGSIPRCLHNIISPIYPVFILNEKTSHYIIPSYTYQSVLKRERILGTRSFTYWSTLFEPQDEVQFITKALSLEYKGGALDLMVGLDLSCNKLSGEIPEELGLLTEIHSLNLSHNQLSGPIPLNLSNLEMIESLDLSSNSLTGEVPSQLIQLHYLSYFDVSYNNLSGGLPDMKAQFSTFTKESYEGNPLLCGPPLEKCTNPSHVTEPSQVTDPSAKEDTDKWYDIDMASFYGTWIVCMLIFAGVLYINPYWRRRWLEFVEESMYTCYYFLEDYVRKVAMLFRK